MIKPCIIIDSVKLGHNISIIKNLCEKYNIKITAVTKMFCCDLAIIEIFINNKITEFADSRIENLIKIQNLKAKKYLLRLPDINYSDDIIQHCDASYNSEFETIKKLSESAKKFNKIHEIILMLELGDLREGILPEDINSIIEKIIGLPSIKLIGLGTNLTCYGGVIPDKDNLGRLVNIAKKIENKYKIKLDIISGGNSSSLYLLSNNSMPERINNLRIGEAFFFGHETAFRKRIENTFQDVCIFKCSIVEIKNKPSLPYGTTALNAFGEKPVFKDTGNRKRALLAAGYQDVDPESLYPCDTNITLIGYSSDYLIYDITDSKTDYKVGDTISFSTNYKSLLRLMTSEYIHKIIV